MVLAREIMMPLARQRRAQPGMRLDGIRCGAGSVAPGAALPLTAVRARRQPGPGLPGMAAGSADTGAEECLLVRLCPGIRELFTRVTDWVWWLGRRT